VLDCVVQMLIVQVEGAVTDEVGEEKVLGCEQENPTFDFVSEFGYCGLIVL